MLSIESATDFNSHRGVDVAPVIPTDVIPSNHTAFKSLGPVMKYDR